MFFDDLKISRKLTLGFAAVTLTMAGMGGAMLVNLRTLDHARDEIKESRQIVAALDEAKFFMTRQENSYRGYLLSKDEYYIDRVNKHRANFKKRLDTAKAALEEGVHLIGLSVLSGSHVEMVEDVFNQLDQVGLKGLPVVIGGIIPESDAKLLKERGIAAVYTPKDIDMNGIMVDILNLIRQANDLKPVAAV